MFFIVQFFKLPYYELVKHYTPIHNAMTNKIPGIVSLSANQGLPEINQTESHICVLLRPMSSLIIQNLIKYFRSICIGKI